jgi:hypothetical protein
MTSTVMFPHFESFVHDARLDRAKGSLSAKLPRILGQGTTRATGMSDPPAPIERKAELAGLEFPAEPPAPESVREEVRAAAEEVSRLRAELKRPDGLRRFVAECFHGLDVEKGQDNGYYFAGRLLLRETKGGFEWAWSVTPHYPIIDKIPPDPTYVVKAHRLAEEKIRALVVAPNDFKERLTLAWHMARRLSKSDDVLVTDVMKMYQVAGQDDKFWQNPKRVYYKDLPEAAFVVNLLHWRSTAASSDMPFTFVPATLSQASGKGAKVFYLPLNAAGTEVRPMIYLRLK